MHCAEEGSCDDHCKSFGLSDTNDKQFRVHCHDNHDSICENCDTLRNVVRDKEGKAQSKDVTCDAQQRGDLLYNVKKAKGHVMEWKTRILQNKMLTQIKVNSIL